MIRSPRTYRATTIPRGSRNTDAVDWWTNAGHDAARRRQDLLEGRNPDAPFDPMTTFFHDVPPDIVSAAWDRGAREPSGTPLQKTWPLETWPNVPTRFLLCRHDRLFPAHFMRRLVNERLGIVPDEMDGGHLPALARPLELVDRLEAYLVSQPPDASSGCVSDTTAV